MSRRQLELFVFDIFVAILKIEHTSSKFGNPQDLLHSYTDWDSVIREFEIIGEASRYLLKENVLENKYRTVVDFRNVIIHEYFGIDEEEVWNIIHKDLKEFHKVIIERIGTMEDDLRNELAESFMEDYRYLDFVVEALGLLKEVK
jgi:uncharacterized protein with HEPN domain